MKTISMLQTGAGLLRAVTTAAGQDTGEAERPAGGMPQLRVQLVINKQIADKKVSSLVYSFPCSDRKTTVKLGVEVPVPVRKGDAVLEFQYRNVGANIECDARTMAEGRFNLRISFEQSSLYPVGERRPVNRRSTAARPTLRCSASPWAR